MNRLVQDNPGRPGKDWTRLVGSVPLGAIGESRADGGRIHRFLGQRSRAVRNAKMEPKRRAAMRSRGQSSEVVCGRFRPADESQWPRGPTVVTAHQHGTDDSGGLRKRRSAQRKTPKGGTKGACGPGRTRDRGRIRENLPPCRRCRKRHRWPVSEKQPESEEARPVARGERTVKSRG